MNLVRKTEIEAPERAEIFHDTFDISIDAGVTLAHIARALGDYLALIVGSEIADSAMARVVASIADDRAIPANWRATLEENESSCFSEWHLGHRLHSLAAYAFFGIALVDEEEPEAVEAWLDSLISEARRFRELSPFETWLGDERSPQLERLIFLAEARWALDHGEPVDPLPLAVFGGISEGRMRNMLSGATRVFTSDERKRIPAHEAMAWLAGREGFWNSIWREQKLPKYARPRANVASPVFVPVARDGSIFHPGLARGGTFTVGEKGEERHVESFDDALGMLYQMGVPAWRRPNEAGGWGLVSGVRWERLDTDDLALFAADTRHRLKGT